jgi:hypothetical protein
MKILRIVFGVLALLFFLMHLLEIPSFLEGFSSVPEELHASRWIGKVIAIFVGAGIAFICFRRKKN